MTLSILLSFLLLSLLAVQTVAEDVPLSITETFECTGTDISRTYSVQLNNNTEYVISAIPRDSVIYPPFVGLNQGNTSLLSSDEDSNPGRLRGVEVSESGEYTVSLDLFREDCDASLPFEIEIRVAARFAESSSPLEVRDTFQCQTPFTSKVYSVNLDGGVEYYLSAIPLNRNVYPGFVTIDSLFSSDEDINPGRLEPVIIPESGVYMLQVIFHDENCKVGESFDVDIRINTRPTSLRAQLRQSIECMPHETVRSYFNKFYLEKDTPYYISALPFGQNEEDPAFPPIITIRRGSDIIFTSDEVDTPGQIELSQGVPESGLYTLDVLFIANYHCETFQVVDFDILVDESPPTPWWAWDRLTIVNQGTNNYLNAPGAFSTGSADEDKQEVNQEWTLTESEGCLGTGRRNVNSCFLVQNLETAQYLGVNEFGFTFTVPEDLINAEYRQRLEWQFVSVACPPRANALHCAQLISNFENIGVRVLQTLQATAPGARPVATTERSGANTNQVWLINRRF